MQDKNPTNFPRVGVQDNIVYSGAWIVRHTLTKKEAVIADLDRPRLHSEACDCCFSWFDMDYPIS